MGGLYFTGNVSQISGSSECLMIGHSEEAITIVAENKNRRGLIVSNDSRNILLIKFGLGITRDSWTIKVNGEAVYEMSMPTYTGVIQGLWVQNEGKIDGGGRALITEIM